MPLTILSCCKIGEYKLPACYIIVTKMLQESETQTRLQVSQRAQNISQNAKCYISLKVKYYKQASEADKRPPMPVIKDKKLL